MQRSEIRQLLIPMQGEANALAHLADGTEDAESGEIYKAWRLNGQFTEDCRVARSRSTSNEIRRF